MFVEPLKDKKSESVIVAFKKIFKKTEQRPLRCQNDSGGEFMGAKFKKFMKENGIIHNATRNPDTKASICERAIRTLKGKIFKYFTYADTLTFIDKLDDFVKAYNNTYHRTIKMTPAEVNDRNILEVYENICQSQKERKPRKNKNNRPKLKVGEYVRMSKAQNVFHKGYAGGWTSEIFKVKKILKRDPVVYRLVDLDDEEIIGTFYEPEIQKVIFDETAAKAIRAIIKERVQGKTRQYLVQWRGYSSKHNSWINASTIASK